MKIKKSIPIYISILTIIILAGVLNIIGLINDLQIETTNKYIYNAVKNSIMFTCLIQIILTYSFISNILIFKQYLIKQQAKQKIKTSLKTFANRFEDKIKEFVNDKHHISKNSDNINDEDKQVAKEFNDKMDRYSFDHSKTTDDFIKKTDIEFNNITDERCINKENNELKSKEVIDFSIKSMMAFSTFEDYYDYLNEEYNKDCNDSNDIAIKNKKDYWIKLWKNCKPRRQNDEVLSSYTKRERKWVVSIPLTLVNNVLNVNYFNKDTNVKIIDNNLNQLG